MEPLRELGRTLLVLGGLLVLVGALLFFGRKLPFHLAACRGTWFTKANTQLFIFR